MSHRPAAAGSGSHDDRGLRRLPHVERLPAGADLLVGPAGPAPRGADALAGFVAASRPWRGQPVPLSGRVTAAFWVLAVVLVLVGAALLVVLRNPETCRGLLCDAATLGGHPRVTLGTAAGSLAVLAVLALPTRGLTRATAPQLAILVAAALVGLVSVTGAVVVLVLLALAVAVVGTALFLLLVSMARSA